MKYSNWVAIRIALVFSVSLVLTASVHGNVTFQKQFDNCAVLEATNEMTNKTSIGLNCQAFIQQPGNLAGIVSITYNEDEGFAFMVRIPAAAVFGSFGNIVKVQLRVDKNDVHTFRWAAYANGRATVKVNTRTATSILNELASGDRAIVQIDETRGYVELNGSREATTEFTKRVNRL